MNASNVSSVTKYQMAIVWSNEDVIVIKDDFCRSCFERKVSGIVKLYSINKAESDDLKKNGNCRIVRIKCEC